MRSEATQVDRRQAKTVEKVLDARRSEDVREDSTEKYGERTPGTTTTQRRPYRWSTKAWRGVRVVDGA